MKKNCKRILLTMFCLILALSTMLVSCNPGDETSQPSESNVSDTSQGSGEERYVASLDPKKYEGKTFKVLALGSTYGTYSAREFGTTEEDVLQSQVINDAAQDKMDYIKEHYGVEVVPVYAKKTAPEDIVSLINDDINTGTGAYDAVMPYFTQLSGLASEGKLLNMAQYDEIDFTKPWWDYSSVEELSIHGKVFFAAGDITLLNKVCTTSVAFNKDLIDELGLESPYDLVKSGDWTFDKMVEMAKQYTGEVDGDGVPTYKDKWGLSSSYGDIVNFYIGMGQHLVTLDTNNEPTIALNTQQAITTAQDILDALNDRSWIIYAQEMDVADIWDMSLRIFGEGRALFRNGAFSAVEKLKANYSVDYGIVPMPKASKEQTHYLSFVATNSTVSGIAMTTVTKDPEFSAYMIEVNAVEGKNYLTDAYYQTVLKGQSVTDPTSIEMLDIIFENTTYDIGRVFNFGNITGLLSQLVQDQSSNIASKLAESESAILADIQKVIESYDNYVQ